MNKKYILSIDQGTTSSRAILINKCGQIIEKSSREINLITPKSGWIEADPIEIWLSVVECINQVLIKSNTQKRYPHPLLIFKNPIHTPV